MSVKLEARDVFLVNGDEEAVISPSLLLLLSERLGKQRREIIHVLRG